MMAERGWTSSLPPQDVASTLVGGPSFKAANTGPRVWAPRSPIMPEPKSHQHRQTFGWYAGWYGRIRAGPIHKSQSSVAGTGGVSAGRAPTGALQFAWPQG